MGWHLSSNLKIFINFGQDTLKFYKDTVVGSIVFGKLFNLIEINTVYIFCKNKQIKSAINYFKTLQQFP